LDAEELAAAAETMEQSPPLLFPRDMRLARVSSEDVIVNERNRAGYQQYVRDHPEEAKNFGIKKPPCLIEGELLVVTLDNNNQPTIYALREVLAADLPSVGGAERELKEGSRPQQAKPQQHLRLGDLARRWHYSKQGVQKLAHHKDFPPPCFSMNGGKIRIWAARDIEKYEGERPELRNEWAKLLKVRGFARARARERQANA
jgi:hypothetical protein